jgi:hypothetical protein
MAVATYKDLCLDATDPHRLGAFWAGALGLDMRDAGPESNGDVVLVGPTPEHSVWVNAVPEPKTVKHRVHLDLNTESVEGLERLGGRVLDADSFAWTVMADPEGGEFCAFVREGELERRLYEIVVDCASSDAAWHRTASWWAEVLGGDLVSGEQDGEPYSAVDNVPQAPFESIVFGPVPEPKTAKNRVHLDVLTDDMGALVAAGATVLRAADEQIRWTVMADPDGNEFCAFLRS